MRMKIYISREDSEIYRSVSLIIRENFEDQFYYKMYKNILFTFPQCDARAPAHVVLLASR